MNPAELLRSIRAPDLPPVHLWNPPLCGEIDIRIGTDGEWFHSGTPIRRAAMVRLFSTLLRRDGEDYYLVTPVEKLRIAVDDVPFIAVGVEVAGDGRDQVLVFTTNVGEQVVAGSEHPLRLGRYGSDAHVPYLEVRVGLWARVGRAAYYHLVERAGEHRRVNGVWSQGEFFALDARP